MLLWLGAERSLPVKSESECAAIWLMQISDKTHKSETFSEMHSFLFVKVSTSLKVKKPKNNANVSVPFHDRIYCIAFKYQAEHCSKSFIVLTVF